MSSKGGKAKLLTNGGWYHIWSRDGKMIGGDTQFQLDALSNKVEKLDREITDYLDSTRSTT